tara:strand:+ start:460 stop:741 length:282 start_codon:yes stop_codon:yes gene_type:complete
MPKKAAPQPSTSPADADDKLSANDEVARFEQEMQELDKIVEQMESGDLHLEESLKLFERGTVLARSCRKSLETAELKVRNLLDDEPAADGDTA